MRGEREIERTVIDQDGMAALTMRGVAAQIRVEAMSLYELVGSRDALPDAVIERIITEFESGLIRMLDRVEVRTVLR